MPVIVTPRSVLTQKTVEIPKFVLGGIVANHRAYPIEKNLRVFGGDTETRFGKPHTFQAFDGDDLCFEYVDEKTIFDCFTSYIGPRCRNRGVNICYFHYLRYDSPVLFFEKRIDMYEQISDIKFTLRGWEVEMLFGKVNTINLTYKPRKGHEISFKVLDSWAFTQAGLDASLKMYKISHSKQEKSKALQKAIGRIDFKKLKIDDPLRVEFESYAKQDAKSEYHLGRAIMEYHKKYLVRPSISLPQFAARVFRHHFFKKDECIQFPPEPCVKASELSYHGGKNGYYLEKPQIIEDAYEIDISSAFPYAMSVLPQFMSGDFAKVDYFDQENVGVYQVSGEDWGRYPIIFDHAFRPIRGKFENTWITGHELQRAIKSNDVQIHIHTGWVWVHDRTYTHNPLAEYVDHFYKLKESVKKEDANYYFYKTMMNGLYGKFCQTTNIRKIEEVAVDPKTAKSKRQAADYQYDAVLKKFIRTSSSFKAGGLYNPFIASQITGFVRGYLYDLEVRFQAFHSATDAVKTTIKPVSKKGLGGIKIETFGRCFAFRNKMYLHFAKSNAYCSHDLSKIKLWDKDQHLCKFGLHGFKGSEKDLFAARYKLMRGESFDYKYDHMIGLREGFRRREDICSMIERTETLDLRNTFLTQSGNMATIPGNYEVVTT